MNIRRMEHISDEPEFKNFDSITNEDFIKYATVNLMLTLTELQLLDRIQGKNIVFSWRQSGKTTALQSYVKFLLTTTKSKCLYITSSYGQKRMFDYILSYTSNSLYNNNVSNNVTCSNVVVLTPGSVNAQNNYDLVIVDDFAQMDRGNLLDIFTHGTWKNILMVSTPTGIEDALYPGFHVSDPSGVLESLTLTPRSPISIPYTPSIMIGITSYSSRDIISNIDLPPNRPLLQDLEWSWGPMTQTTIGEPSAGTNDTITRPRDVPR